MKLWEVLKDLGPTCTLTLASIKQVLADFSSINEEDILEALLMMCNNANEIENQTTRTVNSVYQAIRTKVRLQITEDPNDKKSHITWNFDNFIRACIDKCHNIKWQQVLLNLDRPQLFWKDPQDLLMFFRVLKKLPKNQQFQFPTALIFEKWNNSSSQALFLINLIQAGQPEIVNFNDLPKRTLSLEKLSNIKISSLSPSLLQFFTSLEILELLVELSESDYYSEIRSLFDLPISKCPEILLLGLAQIEPQMGYSLLNELYNQLLPQYLDNYTNSMSLLESIWNLKPQVIISALSETFNKDSSLANLSKIFEICQAIKNSLESILDCDNYRLSISLAILAADKNLITLEQWIHNKIIIIGEPFVSALLNYLNKSIIAPCKNAKQDQYLPILEQSLFSTNNLIALFQLLKSQEVTEVLKEKSKQSLNESYNAISNYFPEIAFQALKPEIEAEANRYFEQTFEDKLSISDLTQKMISFKSSSSEREKNLFLCMMTNLLDEARFFSNYKPRILMIMGQIYGAVILNNLVEGQARDLAFKIILEAMKNKEDKKLYDFGVKALEGFKERLQEWPSKATQLFTVENLWERNLDLLEEIRSVRYFTALPNIKYRT